MALVKFKALTAAEYAALASADSNTIYFETTNKKLYKGGDEYCPQGSYTPPTGRMIIQGNLNIANSTASLTTDVVKGDVLLVTATTSGDSASFGGTTIEAGDMVVALTAVSHDSTLRGQDFHVYKNAVNIHETEWE